MTLFEVFYRFVAGGLRVGSIELPKELNVSIFSFKAKSMSIIGKKVGTMPSTECVLVGLNALGDYRGMG
jgi:hypothetical protein